MATIQLTGMTTPTVDTQDLSFQADPAHQPDKESTWVFPPEEDGWVKAHNAIRQEISLFGRALEEVGNAPLVDWQVRSIQAYWAGHEVHIHGHHSNEDEIFNPFLRTRIAYPDKLEADHVTLVELMGRLRSLVSGLTVGSSAVTLRNTWAEYEATMLPHLHEEEQVGIPLMRAYFTHKEVGALVEKILKGADPIELGAFFHFLGGKREVQAFMKQEGIPSFVWYLKFKGLRTHYRKAMISHADSLIAGRPVVSVHRSKAAKTTRADENAAPVNVVKSK